jgi:hypothetical protein
MKCVMIIKHFPTEILLHQSNLVTYAKSVPESDVFMPLGLALSEKQIPQITENTEKTK